MSNRRTILCSLVATGGALALIVTVVGWLIFAKGILLTIVPSATLARLLGGVHYGENIYLFLIPALLIGCYLTWAGFSSRYNPTPI